MKQTISYNQLLHCPSVGSRDARPRNTYRGGRRNYARSMKIKFPWETKTRQPSRGYIHPNKRDRSPWAEQTRKNKIATMMFIQNGIMDAIRDLIPALGRFRIHNRRGS